MKNTKHNRAGISLTALCLTVLLLVAIGVFSCVAYRSTLPYEDPRAVAAHKAVYAWFKENLNDPSSVKDVTWGTIHTDAEHGNGIDVRYRMKNAVGAYVLTNQFFAIDEAGNATLPK